MESTWKRWRHPAYAYVPLHASGTRALSGSRGGRSHVVVAARKCNRPVPGPGVWCWQPLGRNLLLVFFGGCVRLLTPTTLFSRTASGVALHDLLTELRPRPSVPPDALSSPRPSRTIQGRESKEDEENSRGSTEAQEAREDDATQTTTTTTHPEICLRTTVLSKG